MDDNQSANGGGVGVPACRKSSLEKAEDKVSSQRLSSPRRRSRSPKRYRTSDGNCGSTRLGHSSSKRETSPAATDRRRDINQKLAERSNRCTASSTHDKKSTEPSKADLDRHRHDSPSGRKDRFDSDRGRKTSSSSQKPDLRSDRNLPHSDRERKPRSRSSSRERKRKWRSSSRDQKTVRRRSGSRDRKKKSRSRDRGGSRRHGHPQRSHSRERRKSRSNSRDRNNKGRDYHHHRSRSNSHSSNHGLPKLTAVVQPATLAPAAKPALTTEEQLVANVAKVEKKIIDLNNEKPSVLPLNDYSIPPLMGGVMTPQLAVQQAMAAMNAKAQQLTGVSLPKYYNPAAVNPMKYAEQMQKRKLLWQKKDVKEVVAPSTNNWESTTFAQDQDGAVAAKFKKLMGIKHEQQSAAEAAASQSEEQLRKQEELFRTLDQQYEAARISTHSHRGVGLGFPSAAAAAVASAVATHHSSIASLNPK